MGRSIHATLFRYLEQPNFSRVIVLAPYVSTSVRDRPLYSKWNNTLEKQTQYFTIHNRW